MTVMVAVGGEGDWAGPQLDPERFLGAPRWVMEQTMGLVREEYGGAEGYMDRIGFDAAARARLRAALCDN